MDDNWIRATTVAPAELKSATLELHWAAQYIASAGQTFVTPRPDDSHRGMTWSPKLRAFVGEAFSGPYPFRLALRPADLTLVLIGRTDDELSALPLAGKTRNEGYEWLRLGMATYLGGPPPAVERPEYDMPDHPVRDGAPFSTGMEVELAALEALYDAAAAWLGGLVRTRTDASPVRVWPHHFDIATLITVQRDADGSASRTVGVGLAPMGGGFSEWYGYVSPWPAPDPSRLGELPGPASWHTDGWTGAVLHGSDIAAADVDDRSDLVAAFTAASVTAALAALD